jgi:hypothetical protein
LIHSEAAGTFVPSNFKPPYQNRPEDFARFVPGSEYPAFPFNPKTMELLNQAYDPAVPVETLNLHPENPREGNVGLIVQSIESLGFYGALVCQKSTRYILAGNHRYRSALENEATTLPVIWLDISDDAAIRILLADNKTSDEASNNEAALGELLQAIMADTGTLEGTGYSGDDLDQLISDVLRAANAPEGQATANTPPQGKPGVAPTDTTAGPAALPLADPRTCPQCGHKF